MVKEEYVGDKYLTVGSIKWVKSYLFLNDKMILITYINGYFGLVETNSFELIVRMIENNHNNILLEGYYIKGDDLVLVFKDRSIKVSLSYQNVSNYYRTSVDNDLMISIV